METTSGWLLINLGMGASPPGDTFYPPGKRRFILDFTDGTCLAINLWWFGYVHYRARLPCRPRDDLPSGDPTSWTCRPRSFGD